MMPPPRRALPRCRVVLSAQVSARSYIIMNNVMEFTFTVYKMVGGWWTVKFSVKTIRRMAQIFVALSEKLNFTGKVLY